MHAHGALTSAALRPSADSAALGCRATAVLVRRALVVL